MKEKEEVIIETDSGYRFSMEENVIDCHCKGSPVSTFLVHATELYADEIIAGTAPEDWTYDFALDVCTECRRVIGMMSA